MTSEITQLLKCLHSLDELERLDAVEALEGVGETYLDQVGPALERMLLDPDEMVRNAAAEAIGAIRYTMARPALEQLMRCDVDATVRASAAEALGELGDPGALTALDAALGDEDGAVRSYAALAIGLLGTAEQLPSVHKRLAIELHPPTRGELLAAALRLGDESAFASLVALAARDEHAFQVPLYNAIDDLLARRTPPIVAKHASALKQRDFARLQETLPGFVKKT